MTETSLAGRAATAPGATGALKRVFIVGFPRSGTTWVMYLLTQHPAVVGTHQIGLFHALQPLQHWWHNTKGWGRRVVTAERRSADEGRFEQRGLAQTLGGEEFYEVARGIADRVYAQIAACQPGTQCVVDQTPENLDLAPLILRTYPDAYFLDLVRDPRAVYSSWCKSLQTWAKHNDFVSSPVQIARRWRDVEVQGRELARQTERCLRVRYEDLLGGGGPALERLYRWLGLEADAAFSARAFAACAIDKMQKNVEAPRGFFRKGSADAWRSEVPAAALKIVEHIAREPMQRLGYACVTNPSARRPLRLWAYDSTAKAMSRVRTGLSPELRRRIKSMFKGG